jgi:tetratricopeptide (TPR) repeat protein
MSSSRHSAPSQLRPSVPTKPVAAIAEMARTAIALHQSGNLAEAEQIYRRILNLNPRHTDSLHLLGVLAHQVGRNAIAVQLIGQAIAIDPRQVAYHCNLGTALQALGQWEEAMASYHRALSIQPDFPQAIVNLGVALQALGRLEEAEAAFRRTLALRPDLAEAHINLGNLLQQRGAVEEAAMNHQQALALLPESPDAEFNMGNTRMAQGRMGEAVVHFRRALALRSHFAEAHANLGNALLALEKVDEAAASYERALEQQPDFAVAQYNLGNARQAQGRVEDSLSCFRCAIELNPNLPQAHYNLGNTLHLLDRPTEAEASFRRALELEPRYAQAQYNLGCVLQEQGRYAEATASIQVALESQPEYPQAHFALALALLQAGDFENGWQEAECRWTSEDHLSPWRPFLQPLWKGEKLAAGKVLLWGEQGIGDEIQFAGLVNDALRSGNQIVLDCEPRLLPLFARSFPQVEMVTDLRPEQAEESGLAAHLPTGSLPLLYRRQEADFATGKSPYLQADAALTAEFRERYSHGKKRIGVTWFTRNAKSGRKRSIDLTRLAPLFAVPEICWVSLQYGDCDDLEEQARKAGAPLDIDRSVDQFVDIDRFAAQVAAMDLVISIDNSTVHLAGALGRPVWAMLPFAADWRWMVKRPDSPWYPSLRLFRQQTPGDWESVLQPILQALGEEAAHGATAGF